MQALALALALKNYNMFMLYKFTLIIYFIYLIN